MENEFWYLIQFLENFMFGTICICESMFSTVNFMKSKWSVFFDKYLVSELKCSKSIKYTVAFKDTEKNVNINILILKYWLWVEVTICWIYWVNKIIKLFCYLSGFI